MLPAGITIVVATGRGLLMGTWICEGYSYIEPELKSIMQLIVHRSQRKKFATAQPTFVDLGALENEASVV